MSRRADRYLATAEGDIAYVTIDGDMVDDITHAYYGRHRGNTELVYAANPGLAERGPTLPAGLVVKLPAVPSPAQPRQFRRLWD